MATFNPQFMQGAQMQIANNDRMFGMINNAIGQYQKGKALQSAKAEAKRKEQLNPQNILVQAQMSGLESLDPEQLATLKAYDAQKQMALQRDPTTGASMPANQSIFNVIGQPQRADVNVGYIPSQPAPDYSFDATQANQPIDVVSDDVIVTEAGNPKLEQLSKEQALKQQYSQRERDAKKGDLKEYNENQLQSTNFLNRMKKSSDIMRGLVSEDPKANKARMGFKGGVESTMRNLPLGDTGSSLGAGIAKALSSSNQKQYLNAAENWVTANLRKESGAVIGPEEMQKEIAKYFPTPFDDEKVISQKARLRGEAEKGMYVQSGGAFDLMGDGAKKTTPTQKTKPNKPTKEQVAAMMRERGFIR